jgi:hypothetical protein
MWKASNKILNNIFKNEYMPENTPQGKALGISLIANYLGLNTDAAEGSVLTEVQNKINSAILAKTKAEEEIDAKKREIEKMQKELDKMKKDAEDAANKFGEKCKELDALIAKNKADAEEADNKVKEAEKATKAVAAKAMVEGFAKIGKIKNEPTVVARWVEKAIVDFEGIKKDLEDIPLNKVAPTIHVGPQNKDNDGGLADPNAIGMSAMHLQARIRANAIKNKQTA